MTKEELDKILETDLFQQKGFLVRYLDYGKAIASTEILDDLDKIDKELSELQRGVEQTHEKAALEGIVLKYKGKSEDVDALLAEFETLIKDVDQAHTELIKTFKKPKLEALREKYRPKDPA